MLLKQCGILLAIISKNEEVRVRALWPGVFGEKLKLADFASVQINWQPKVENMHAVLGAMILLPQSVVFIDDNPAERDAMQRAFPSMRILGRHPLYLRHTLLCSAETQGSTLTGESVRRTEMIQAQLHRESDRTAISREEFLRAASPVVTFAVLNDMDHANFTRAQELIGKTNQFNTTGRRWTVADYTEFFKHGGYALTFEVTDAYTPYGLVGVVLVQRAQLVQFVMSCRVLGYGVEQAALAHLAGVMRAGGVGAITAQLVETEVNFPCREVFAKAGFHSAGTDWDLNAGDVPVAPAWVRVG